ncbi:MAG TPA: hypothetical protein VGE45_00525 [Chloroflexia bacterium]|jgi:hypothetical protein
MAETQRPSIGRIVHYVARKNGTADTKCQAAIITAVNDNETVNLQVFNDGPNDGWSDFDGSNWKGQVGFAAAEKRVGEHLMLAERLDLNTWHWPERV